MIDNLDIVVSNLDLIFLAKKMPILKILRIINLTT